jgi:hypothetical protein
MNTKADDIDCDVCEHTHPEDECPCPDECYEECQHDGCQTRLGYKSCMPEDEYDEHPDRFPGYNADGEWFCPAHRETASKPEHCDTCSNTFKAFKVASNEDGFNLGMYLKAHDVALKATFECPCHNDVSESDGDDYTESDDDEIPLCKCCS